MPNPSKPKAKPKPPPVQDAHARRELGKIRKALAACAAFAASLDGLPSPAEEKRQAFLDAVAKLKR